MDFNSGLPLGLGMALAMNETAMSHYVNLTEVEKEKLLARAKSVKSRAEMDRIVNMLSENETWDSSQLDALLGPSGIIDGPGIG